MAVLWAPHISYPHAQQCPHCRAVFTFTDGDVTRDALGWPVVKCQGCARSIVAVLPKEAAGAFPVPGRATA